MSIRILLIAGIAGLGAAFALPAQAASVPATTGAETAPLTDVSVQNRKRNRAQRSARARGNQVACTRFGCRPIPRNCRITTEFNPWSGNPTGFDAVVCR